MPADSGEVAVSSGSTVFFFRSENWPISNLCTSLVLRVFFKINVCFTSHHRARQATAYMDSKVIKCMEMKKLDFY